MSVPVASGSMQLHLLELCGVAPAVAGFVCRRHKQQPAVSTQNVKNQHGLSPPAAALVGEVGRP